VNLIGVNFEPSGAAWFDECQGIGNFYPAAAPDAAPDMPENPECGAAKATSTDLVVMAIPRYIGPVPSVD
jgi:hypothetical protein